MVGFAVVAEEIRMLANETSHAVDDIHQKIEQIRSNRLRQLISYQRTVKVLDRINDTVADRGNHRNDIRQSTDSDRGYKGNHRS